MPVINQIFQTSTMIDWRAIAWGLFYLVGMVIILKLLEGFIFSSLPYDSRGIGRFLSPAEYRVQGYTPGMLLGFLAVHVVKIAVPSYMTAQAAGRHCVLNASVLVLVSTGFNWLVFQAVVRMPGSEFVGLAFSLCIAVAAAKACDARRKRSAGGSR